MSYAKYLTVQFNSEVVILHFSSGIHFKGKGSIKFKLYISPVEVKHY